MSEPPTAIVPTLRCWRWWALQRHRPHTTGLEPKVRRCPGFRPPTLDKPGG